MTHLRRSSPRSPGVISLCFAALVLSACAQPSSDGDGTGGASSGGDTGTGGSASGGSEAKGGSTGTGGIVTSSGGAPGSGGIRATGGVTGSGGAEGGSTGTGGLTGAGGIMVGTGGVRATGGVTGTGGGAKGGFTGSGGFPGIGGKTGAGGMMSTGGVTGSGGNPGSGGGSSTVTCGGAAPSGGTMHSGNSQGTAGGLSWSLWSNGSGGSITTYSTPAFSANWNNSGDFLARIGLQWGNGKAYTTLGTVTATFDETKSGSAGGYSYIGIYGWSVNPCVEWYIVDDSYSTSWPFNPGGTVVTTASIDGGTYNLITRSTTGTGGNRCGNVSSWQQFYSVRQTKRTCGTISITDHFNAWDKANMKLGAVLEASILIEAGGGTGSIVFPTANVTAQ